MKSDSTDKHADMALESLRRAVAKALDRKRRLGQYAIVWRDGRVVRLSPEELPIYSPESEQPSDAGTAAEPQPGYQRNSDGNVGG